MTIYRRFISPFVPMGDTAPASTFASLMAERLRNNEKGRQKTALDDWEDEGGSVAATNATVPEPSSIDTEVEAQSWRCGQVVNRALKS